MWEQFRSVLLALGIELTDEQLGSFEAFEEHLYKANETRNLTRVPREECWLRHFVDSLLFHDLLPEGASVLDVGTGPGFPAWPLACARPDLKVTALDSNGKMLAFLRSQPLPNLALTQARAEESGEREKFDVVTGRAVAPLPAQLEISAAFARVGGRVIPMRTTNDHAAIVGFDPSQFGLVLKEVETRRLVGTEVNRVFPVYEKIRPTPRRYPRKWAEIKKG